MAKIKLERVNAELKKQIATIISEEVNDPRVKGLVSVVKVDCDNDLDHAKVYLSVLGADGEEESVVKAIANAEGFIKGVLKKRIQIRQLPHLKFLLDDSIRYGVKISEILSNITYEGENDGSQK